MGLLKLKRPGVGAGSFIGDFEVFGIDPKTGEQRDLTNESLEFILNLWNDPKPGLYENKKLYAATDVVLVNGAEVDVNATDGVMVNQANVVTADVGASNGVIHVIDAVLLPK